MSFYRPCCLTPSIRGASTQNDCFQAPPPFAGEVGEEKDINGAKFKAFEVGDNWAGGGQRGTVYRGFRGGTCYELSVQIVVSRAALETQQDVDLFYKEEPEVRVRLMQVLDTFRFVK
jgi:hypothetical protein